MINMSSISVAKNKQIREHKRAPLSVWLRHLSLRAKYRNASRYGIRFGFPRAERVELASPRQAVGIFARSANILVISRKSIAISPILCYTNHRKAVGICIRF